MINDPNFEDTLPDIEKEAWKAFVLVVKNFLGNVRAENYVELVNNMLENFQKAGCRMSLKMHFLHSHLDFSHLITETLVTNMEKGFIRI